MKNGRVTAADECLRLLNENVLLVINGGAPCDILEAKIEEN